MPRRRIWSRVKAGLAGTNQVHFDLRGQLDELTGTDLPSIDGIDAMTAQSLHKSKSALGAYYRRMRSRCGPAKAITATAHKLAILIYRLLKYGKAYVDQGQQAYEKQYQERTLQMLKRRVKQMGYALVALPSGELVS